MQSFYISRVLWHRYLLRRPHNCLHRLLLPNTFESLVCKNCHIAEVNLSAVIQIASETLFLFWHTRRIGRFGKTICQPILSHIRKIFKVNIAIVVEVARKHICAI